MLLWEVKPTSGVTYTTMKSPSSYKIDWEDLDNNSYRSKNSGNLIDTVISKSWAKIQFNYNCLSEIEMQDILPKLSNNPIYVKAKNPVFGNEYVEMEMRCSKKSAEMLETGDYTLSFNLVQKKKVSGQ